MTADQRFASPPGRTYSCTRRRCWTTDTTIGRADRGGTVRESTTGTDADWVVKVIDVYPDDYPDNEPPADAVARATPNRPAVSDVRMGGYQHVGARRAVIRGQVPQRV